MVNITIPPVAWMEKLETTKRERRSLIIHSEL